MRPIANLWSHLRIKWKLTIGAAFVFFILFTFSNMLQYQIVNHWIKGLEINALDQSVSDARTFISTQKNWGDQSLSTLTNNLRQLTDRNELILLYNSKGKLITKVTQDIPTSWVTLHAYSSSATWNVYKQNEHLMVRQSPFVSENLSGTIVVARNMDMYDNLLKLIKEIMIIVGIGALLISLLTGFLLSKQLLNPIKNLKTTIERIQRKGLQERVDLPNSKDELTSLSLMFNDMMDKVEMTFNTQKQFVEDASHELRTPLSILEGHLALIKRWGKNDKKVMEESLDTSLHELKRMKGLVNDLLALSKIEEADKSIITSVEDLDPLPILKRMVDDFKLLYPNFTFQLSGDIGEPIKKIKIDEHHFEQIVTILLDNAIKYSLSRKEVELLLKKRDKLLVLSIKDWGVGIKKEELDLIFNRFYRVDKTRSRERGGNGLGLSIAKRLVKLYNGDLVVNSQEGVGTVASVSFDQAELI